MNRLSEQKLEALRHNIFPVKVQNLVSRYECSSRLQQVISFTLCHTKVDGMIQFRTVSYRVVTVLKLLRAADLTGKWHHVFCDSFFTSIRVVVRLFNLNKYLTGTIRKNRHPNANGSIFARRGPVLCCAYRERPNRKVVRFVSTYCHGVHSTNEKSKIATDYNQSMGGVDLNDMMSGIYEDKRKTKAM